MKKIIIVMLLVTSLLVAAGCGSAAVKEEAEFDYSENVSSDSGMSYPRSSQGGIGEASDEEYAPEPPSEVIYAGIDTERMIVRTGDIRMVVGDIAVTLEDIAGIAQESGGYVVSSNRWKEDERYVGTISVRVPTELFDDTMGALRELADEVTFDQTSSQDVTEEYVDLQAKLKNLEATEEQLLVIMQKAEDVEDILEVQRELTNVRDDIERTQGRMQYLEQTSDMSYISVSLTQSKLDVRLTAVSGRYITGGEEVIFTAEITGGFSPYTYEWDFGDGATSTKAQPAHAYSSAGEYTVSLTVTDDRGNTDTDTREGYVTVQSGWNPGNIAKSAWKGLRTFGQVLINILIWVGIFSPVLIAIGVVVFLVRRRIRRRKAEG